MATTRETTQSFAVTIDAWCVTARTNLYENNFCYNISSHSLSLRRPDSRKETSSCTTWWWECADSKSLSSHLRTKCETSTSFFYFGFWFYLRPQDHYPSWRQEAQSEWRLEDFECNHNQVLQCNHVAGVCLGSGLFFSTHSRKRRARFCWYNVAHSIYAFAGGNDRYPPLTFGWGLFVNHQVGTSSAPCIGRTGENRDSIFTDSGALVSIACSLFEYLSAS